MVLAAASCAGVTAPARPCGSGALKAIRVGKGSQDIVITPDGRTAYVLNAYPPSVVPVQITCPVA